MKRVIAALATLASACTSPTDSVCGGDVAAAWQRLPASNAVRATNGYASAWTGRELLIWGGDAGTPVDGGGRYDPLTNRWAPLAKTGAPSAREYASAVWTGSELIVWGGDDGTRDLSDGARYDPALDRWTPMSTVNAPSRRHDAITLWTGSEVLIVGGHYEVGFPTYGRWLDDGALYNPVTDSWRAVAPASLPSTVSTRVRAVWTGREVVFWGMGDDLESGAEKARSYDPSTNTWRRISTMNAAPYHEPAVMAVRDGKVLVWSADGYQGRDGYVGQATGALYDPATDSWTRLPSVPVDAADAIVAGDLLVVSSNTSGGGWLVDPIAGTQTVIPDQGDSWRSLAWTGSEVIVWNRFDDPAGPTSARLVLCDGP